VCRQYNLEAGSRHAGEGLENCLQEILWDAALGLLAMRKAIFILLATVASSNATAAWIPASVSEAGTTYIDTATIRRAGDKVQMWELMDYKIVPDKDHPYKSMRKQTEYDCKERQSRLLFASSHSERLGNGETVTTVAKASNWMALVPGSVGEMLWKVACGKRWKSL
jgi:hypothetical protein